MSHSGDYARWRLRQKLNTRRSVAAFYEAIERDTGVPVELLQLMNPNFLDICYQMMQQEMRRQQLVNMLQSDDRTSTSELPSSAAAAAAAAGLGTISEETPARCDQLTTTVDEMSLTSDEYQPDMITLDCFEPVRAIMPCGHVIGPQSLLDYCMKCVLPAGSNEITCPNCGAVWEYSTVRHVACLNAAETQELECELTENYFRRTFGYQRCKRCDNWCCRENPDSSCLAVFCPVCSREKEIPHSFCWGCLEELSDDGCCGCAESKFYVSDQLENCAEKSIVGIVCPSVRACPQCFTLFEHVNQCQHVLCQSCRYWFCFICLRPSGLNGAYAYSPDACHAWNACSGVADRQINKALRHTKLAIRGQATVTKM